MKKSESIREFYEQIGAPVESTQFSVYAREEYNNSCTAYNRKEFYKITLLVGTNRLLYADKGIEIDKPALLFSNPMIPYYLEPVSEHQSGYLCVFTEDFFKGNDRSASLQESPLFKIGNNPVFFLNDNQVAYVSDIFQKMKNEVNSAYIYKYDLLRNFVNLLIHEALKLQPAENYFKHHNAASRIASLFLELLQRQFPINSPQHRLTLKTASDYAANLSIHVNHLNSSVKEITGKATTSLISERVIQEANILLKSTDWSISEIAYSLGFESSNYFNNFYKKHTGVAPSKARKTL